MDRSTTSPTDVATSAEVASMEAVDDRHVSSYEPIPSPAELRDELPASSDHAEVVRRGRREIAAALRGEDDRMVAIVGPCSIHDPTAAVEYAERLRSLRDELDDRLVIVMRTYFEKPRTSIGWKGLIYDPSLDGTSDASRGLRVARQVLLDVTGLGLPCAVEVLDTITPQYQSDLVAWAAIGARTVESQVHRQLASGLSMPVGFKNGTDGSLGGAINALGASVSPHAFFGIDGHGRTNVIRTSGNPDVHIVLRGGNDGPNHDEETVRRATQAGRDATSLARPVIVDCSHGNSGKDHRRQAGVADDVLSRWGKDDQGVAGLMLESNLAPGRQDWSPDTPLQHGVSITDACIGWDETVEVLRRCADAVASRR